MAVSADDIDALHAATALYTTRPVVSALLDQLAWPERGGRLLDPSAGDGAFLLEALRRIPTPPADYAAVDRVRGWEIHPGAVNAGRQRLSQFLFLERGWPIGAAQFAALRLLRQGDFLTMQHIERGHYALLVGNPPYLRYANLTPAFKARYASLPDHARGDLLHAFLARCCELLAPDGVLGFVTADRWLFNVTAAQLRERIGQHLGIASLERLDARTAFYRPKVRTKHTPPRVHPVAVVLDRAARASRPLSREPLDLHGRAAHHGPTLRDIASIRVAPWLGPLGVFVVNVEQARILPPEWLVPAVDTDDIDPHTDELRPPTRWALRVPRGVVSPPAVQSHLARNAGLLSRRAARGLPWQPPERISLDLSQPALLVPRIAQRVRVIALPAGILPVNHNLQVLSSGTLCLDELRALLLSETTAAWIMDNAPRLEPPYRSITTSLLRRLPLPNTLLR